MENQNKSFFEITVKAVILNDKDEVLLIKRPEKDHHGAGKWDLPGGKLEAGEYIQEGLNREIKEETGLESETETILLADDFGKKYDKKIKIGDKEYIVSGKGLRFLARYRSGEVKLSEEHKKFVWVSLEKANQYFGDTDFEKDKKESLERAQKYLKMKNAMSHWKRCLADFENYKKRTDKAKEEITAFSNVNLITQILPVLDNFYASTEHIPEDQKETPWVVGMMHIQRQLEKVLIDNGVKKIEVKVGDKFNPETMEALENLENKENKKENFENKVAKIIQRGYQIEKRIIKPVRVIVE